VSNFSVQYTSSMLIFKRILQIEGVAQVADWAIQELLDARSYLHQ
jgi:hypothetical protein